MSLKNRLVNFYRSRPIGIFIIMTMLAAFGVVLGIGLLVSIFERKQEARNPFYRVVELSEEMDDPAIWGKNFPMQYDAYRRTVDQVRTKYGGSEAMPHAPTQADPGATTFQ